MKLTFLGAAHEVTGSCALLEVCGKQLLIDCGMEQGADIYENYDLPMAPGELDAIFLTHAHIDHSGKIPAMVAQGYTGPVYTTHATARLCDIMLRDSAHIQESEAQWRNRKAKRSGGEPYVPIYTTTDAEQTLRQLKCYDYEEVFSPFPGVTVRFRDAGHLLGSASIYITAREDGQSRTILFSGDLGNHTRPLIRDPQPAQKADYVVIESTYGDRLHGERPDYIGQLTRILQDTFDRGGNLVIPCFAVGRTQELLYLIRQIKNEGLIHGHDGFEVYVDSPMAVEATKIYAAGLTAFYDKETLALLQRGEDPICFDGLRLALTAEESKLINVDQKPKVILSASGMCEAGRIRHHLKHNLWRSDSTVLFVGYQSGGTLGRRIIDGAKSVKLFNETIAVNCHVENLDGISGHADRDGMIRWLSSMPAAPERVFVNHGEDGVCDAFADHISATLGYTTTAPFSGDEYDLLTNTCTAKGKVLRISKESKGRTAANAVFQRLVEAGKRLNSAIQSCKGLSNKELSRFADKITSLCDQYSKK